MSQTYDQDVLPTYGQEQADLAAFSDALGQQARPEAAQVDAFLDTLATEQSVHQDLAGLNRPQSGQGQPAQSTPNAVGLGSLTPR